MAGTDYQYCSSLPIGSIRILGLLPGDRSAPIKCTLQTKTLDEATDSYEAISYCWGLTPDVVSIDCDGHRLPITRNLLDALRQFRDANKVKHFWADAICINQHDVLEKGHQVKRMGNVFERASRVVAWLGPDDDNLAQDALALIRETVSYLDAVYIADQYRYFPPLDPATCPIERDQTRWDGVRALLAMGWFERAWVVQEGGLGKECELHWGSHSIPLADVVEMAYYSGWRTELALFTGDLRPAAVRILASFVYIQLGFDNPVTWRMSRPVLAWRSRQFAPRRFMDVILASRKLRATDHRDYLYAFLGSPLALREDGGLLVEPNYGDNAPGDVFLEAAVALLAKGEEAPWVVLYVNHSCEEQVEGRTLPSWVPRWDTLEDEGLAESVFWFQAGGSAQEFRPEVVRLDEGLRLRVDVFVFDEVEWASPALVAVDFDFDRAQWTPRPSGKPYIDEVWDDVCAAVDEVDDALLDEFILCLVQAYPLARTVSYSYKTKKTLRERFGEYQRHARAVYDERDPDSPPHLKNNPWAIMNRLIQLDNKRIIRTKGGRMGIGPGVTKRGDVCCVSPGLANPLLIRASASKTGGVHHLVGAAYVNHVMKGELLDEGKVGLLKRDIIELA